MSLRSKTFAVLVGLGVAGSAWGAERTDSAVGPAYRGAVRTHKTVGPMGSGAVRTHKAVGPDAQSTERTSDRSAQAPQKAEDKVQLDLNAGF